MAVPGRILVEGGPVDVRSKRLIAAILGFVLGYGLIVGILVVVALNASQDAHEAIRSVKASRVEAIRLTCREDNEHHKNAKRGLAVLVVQTETHKPTHAQIKRQEFLLGEFVQAFAPSYNCKLRVKELTKP
jgi:hypothetical protein